MNGAGTRNAIFDSVFFGSQHLLQNRYGFTPAASYAAAAGTAVAVDYSVDMALKRIMVVAPSECVPGLLTTIRGFFAGQEHGLLRSLQLVHRGLSAKVIEFSVNYGVMGFTSVYTYAALRRITGGER